MEKRSLMVDNVYNAIKKDFINNTIGYGDKLVVRVLAERYHTSGTPVKLALNRLVSEGLVEAIPGRGVFRKKISFDSVKEIMEIRLMIELYYVDRVIANLDLYPDVVKKMEELTEKIRDTILKMDNMEKYFLTYQLDKQFHMEYLKCAGNYQAILIYDRLGTHSYESLTYGKMSKERLLVGSVDEHFDIVNALKRRDAKELSDCLQRHYKNVLQTFETTFKQDRMRTFLS